MYQPCTELGGKIAFVGVIALLLLGGCASPGGEPGARESSSEVQQDSAREKPPAGAVAGPSEHAALVEVDEEVGFTVTEVVTIPSDVRNRYREAMSYVDRQDYQRGISLLVEITTSMPDVTGPFIDLGIAYRFTGEHEDAESSFRQALALTPDHPVANNELGILYRKLGRFSEARESYERALAVYPGFHFARRNLAVLCDLYLADLSCALEQYELYRASVPDDPEVDIWIADIRNRVPSG